MSNLNQRGKIGEPQRNLWCSYYPFCLDIHVRYEKTRFSCARCVRYRPIHLEVEDIVEEAVRCGEFLRALFFGLPEEEMPRRIQEAPSEFVSVPVHLLRGLIYSFYQGMESLQSSYNITIKLEEVLKQREKRGQLTNSPEGTPSEPEPGAETGDTGE